MQHNNGGIDLSRTLTRSLDNVPKKHRGKWARCVEVAADALRDADEGQRLRGDALVLVLPRLLLAPGRSSGSSRSAISAQTARSSRPEYCSASKGGVSQSSSYRRQPSP